MFHKIDPGGPMVSLGWKIHKTFLKKKDSQNKLGACRRINS
jgi:hypothetical protein